MNEFDKHGDEMAMQHSDCEKAKRILSQMEYGRPVAMASISQRTGLRLAEIIRLCDMLVAGRIIQKNSESGVCYYTLRLMDYEDEVDELFAYEADERDRPARDSREVILQRRRFQKESMNSVPAAAEPRQDVTSPEPLTAIDLMNMRRSSATNAKVDVFSDRRSSGTNRAVFVNKGWEGGRSLYTTPTPQMGRSDTNFKQVNPGTHFPNLALIPSSALSQTNNEIPVHELRERLEITDSVPLLAILSPRPTNEVWEACSAIVNAGGGILVLGMRQYGEGESATYFVKSVNNPEESIKNLMRGFANRDIISDSPRDVDFIETVEFGKKTVLVLRLSPSLFNNAPLYLARDSFGRRTDDGCFMYRDGKVGKCSPDEVKALWESLRLGAEKADWDQTGEQVPVRMDHKVKIKLSTKSDETAKPQVYREHGRERADSGRSLPFGKTGVDDVKVEGEMAEESGPKKESFDALVQDGFAEIKEHRRQGSRKADAGNTLQRLLFAEDIQSAGGEKTGGLNGAADNDSTNGTAKDKADGSVAVDTHRSKRNVPRMHIASATLVMPPDLEHADRAVIEKIAEPAVSYTRLPTARLAEIVASILHEVRVTPEELGEIINRKQPAVKKILATLKGDERFRSQGKTFYMV